jgi:hypothetical protein
VGVPLFHSFSLLSLSSKEGGLQMPAYLRTSFSDTQRALKAFLLMMDSFRGRKFQVCRCAKSAEAFLKDREEYRDATVIQGLWVGAEPDSAKLESEMFALAARQLPDKYRAREAGGESMPPEEEQVVYVVVWEK